MVERTERYLTETNGTLKGIEWSQTEMNGTVKEQNGLGQKTNAADTVRVIKLRVGQASMRE